MAIIYLLSDLKCAKITYMEEKDIIAANLVSYRKRAGLSQLELAEKLQYSNKNISKWENGETTPNVFTLKKIADIFGITVDQLICEPLSEVEEQTQKKVKLSAKRKKIFDYFMLLLSMAILFAVASTVIYVIAPFKLGHFNKWLIYLYMAPLCAIAVFIFIRCVYKRLDIISLSLMGWLICLSFHLTFLDFEYISMVYVLGAAYQLVVICITVLVNLKLFTKFADHIRSLRSKRKQAQ